MFTGIIKTMGTVVKVDSDRGDPRFYIQSDLDLSAIDIGASVCHAGCCLTVVEKDGDVFATDVSAETLSKTTLGEWAVGTKINLETSLKMGDEMGGHIVSGHVDGVAKIISIIPEGDSHRLVIEVQQGLAKFIAPKGSVALDGISLTVNEVNDNQFGINIIPHTWDITTLGQRAEGDSLNIEIDTIARYAIRAVEHYNK
jgi:riboflavin synthase